MYLNKDLPRPTRLIEPSRCATRVLWVESRSPQCLWLHGNLMAVGSDYVLGYHESRGNEGVCSYGPELRGMIGSRRRTLFDLRLAIVIRSHYGACLVTRDGIWQMFTDSCSLILEAIHARHFCGDS